MLVRWMCPEGHEWERDGPELKSNFLRDYCPECGKTGFSITGSKAEQDPTCSANTSEKERAGTGVFSGTELPPPDVEPPATSETPTVDLSGAKARPVAHRLELPGYDVFGEVGRGGMGVVFKARHRKLKRFVALKVMLAGELVDVHDLERFNTEAQVLAKVQHPNIVQIYDTGIHNGQPFLALEYVPGHNLAQQLSTPWTAEESARLLETLARAIHVAHQAGVVHRDLKPSNVLLTQDGLVKITDFGIAKMLNSSENLTRTGGFIGTPEHVAPEQARGENDAIGPATDVYSLGTILYECLTGRPPFKGATPMATLEQVAEREPVPPARLQPLVPRDLDTICLKCLEKEQSRRYQTAEELAEDLRRFQSGEPITARRVQPVEHVYRWARRHPVVSGLLAVIVLLLLTGMTGTYVIWRAVQKREAEVQQALFDVRRAQDEVQWKEYRMALRAAEHDFLDGNVPNTGEKLRLQLIQRARERLERTEKSFRGWEHACLTRQLRHVRRDPDQGNRQRLDPPREAIGVEGLRYVRQAHDSTLSSLCFHPQGERFVTGGWDALVKVWEVSPLGLLRVLEGHFLPVQSVIYVPKGDRIISGAGGLIDEKGIGEIFIWEEASGKKLREISGLSGMVHSLAVHPSKPCFVSAGGGEKHSELKLWDLNTGKLIRELKGHVGIVLGVAFSPDGQSIASAGSDNTVRLWASSTGKQIRLLRGHEVAVTCVAFHPLGTKLASGDGEGNLRIWRSADGKLLHHQKPAGRSWNELAFTPKGRRVVASDINLDTLELLIFDVKRGELAHVFRASRIAQGGAYGFAFSRNEDIIVGAEDGSLHLLVMHPKKE